MEFVHLNYGHIMVRYLNSNYYCFIIDFIQDISQKNLNFIDYFTNQDIHLCLYFGNSLQNFLNHYQYQYDHHHKILLSLLIHRYRVYFRQNYNLMVNFNPLLLVLDQINLIS